MSTTDPSLPLSLLERSLGKRLEPGAQAEHIESLWRISKAWYAPEQMYVWPRNQHMVYGRQWLDFNPIAQKFFPQKPTMRDRRVTSNHLLGRVSQFAARLVSARPSFTVLPKHPDFESRASARLAEEVLAHSWRAEKIHLHRYFATLQAIIYGMGILKAWYDKDSGPVHVEYKPTVGLDGELLPVDPESDRIDSVAYKGRIRVEAISPAELHPAPGVYWPILSMSPYLIHEVHMTPEEIKERWGVEVDASAATTQESNSFASGLAQDINNMTFYGLQPIRRDIGKVIVLEYHEQASTTKGYYQGKVIWAAGGKKLGEDSSQFEDGSYPFVGFPGTPEPGRIWPHSWVSDLVEPQVNYNRTRTRLRTWEDLMFYPKVLNPATSGIPDRHFKSGLNVLNYEPYGGKPEFWTAPPPPSAAFQTIGRDLEDMSLIGQQFGVSMGQSPKAGTSGALAQLLVEQDATELGPILNMHARAWEELGGKILDLYRVNRSEEDLYFIVGQGQMAEVRSFKASAIPIGLQVEVQEDSLLPQIKSARVQTMKELVGMQLYDLQDPKTRKKTLEFMGQPTAMAGIETPEEKSRNIARQENYKLVSTQEPVQRRPTDDDQVHIEEMLDRANDPDTLSWPQPVWARFLGHLQEHQKAIETEMEAEQQKQMDQAKQMAMVQALGKGAESAMSSMGQGQDNGNGVN